MSEGDGAPGSGTGTAPLSVLFGDRRGLAVFLGSVIFLGVLWRVGFFLTDSTTVANLLANVADGRLELVEAPYSLTAGSQPGLVEVGGNLYGRNYGEVYLATPVLWALDLASAVADLRLLLAGLWAGAIVALGRAIDPLLDRDGLSDLSALVGFGAFLVAVAAWTPLAPVNRPLIALQLTTILVAAAGATLLYRLLATVGHRRVALAGGLAMTLSTPIGFWGSLPKRHVFTATLLLLACFWFAVGRARADRRGTLARAGAYGAIGFLAAIHAFEAAFMLAVLAPIDLATNRSAPIRQHAVVVVVFLVAMGPMLATNAAISGDPVKPPRLLPSAGSGSLPADLGDDLEGPGAGSDGSGGSAGGGSGDGGGGGSGGGDSGDAGGDGAPSGGGLPIGEWLAPFLEGWTVVAWIGANLLEYFTAGLAVLPEVDRLYHTFFRSGWIPVGVDYSVNGYEAVELAFLEAFPLAAALLAWPVLAVQRGRTWLGERGTDLGPVSPTDWRPVDLLAGAMAVVFLVIYLPLLPLHSMITLRYVVPAMPLLLYLCCRLGPVRAAIVEAPAALARGYGATLFLGGLAGLVGLPVIDPAVGEAFQLHALVGLGTAAVAAAAVGTWPRHRRPRVVAVGLAIPAAATTLFLVFAALWHVPFGEFALDLSRLVAGFLGPLG